jgi:hypothetical protein
MVQRSHYACIFICLLCLTYFTYIITSCLFHVYLSVWVTELRNCLPLPASWPNVAQSRRQAVVTAGLMPSGASRVGKRTPHHDWCNSLVSIGWWPSASGEHCGLLLLLTCWRILRQWKWKRILLRNVGVFSNLAGGFFLNSVARKIWSGHVTIHPLYSVLLVRVLPNVISLQLCTPKAVGV